MANEKQLIRAVDVYSLFDMNGKKTLHVVDIDLIQRVDAVEVVRCKDCKFWREDILRDDDEMKCCSIGFYMTKGDNFCSFGKRREGE